ncbi:MAG: NADH-quinone oxidoreductase subunit NuoK [Caldimicrobium sp.]|nr:NADH-quinone oxidoreductase subunit NuoK [Caldimicrobium sp.]MCX7873399.1 NADH-quinone oxidoreductase subunit NuoK [Caldimicrobium sp.]MDW8094377.1 NADH-quinone oxidoreductase subunit NuoK [Caldimicrobium sp.]
MSLLKGYLVLGLTLFGIGLIGFITRRNIIMMLISIEIMLNAVNIKLVALSYYILDLRGQVMALFIMGSAGGAVAVGLIILIMIYRNRKTVDVEKYDLLREK